MKVPYSWLQDYVDINVSPKELGDKLTLTGSQLEELIIQGDTIDKVVTGKIGNLSVVGKSSSSSVDLGGTVTITGTATGENSPFTYSFIVYNHATGGWYRYAFGSSNVLTWTAMSEGTRTFYVEAKDSKGNVIRSEGININVN